MKNKTAKTDYDKKKTITAVKNQFKKSRENFLKYAQINEVALKLVFCSFCI